MVDQLITCDICGRFIKRSCHNPDLKMYRFKRRQFDCFVNGKDEIKNVDVCAYCLNEIRYNVRNKKEGFE